MLDHAHKHSSAHRLLLWVLRVLAGSPQAERRWRREASASRTGRGEAQQPFAKTIAARCPQLPVLHDCRIPGVHASIDHIAFAPSGVYVIDTKRCRGRIRTASPRSAEARLQIGERDQTPLIAKMNRQLAVVRTALESIGEEVPVHGCLCLLSPEGSADEVRLALLRTVRVAGVPLYTPRRLTRRLNRRGPVSREHAEALHAELAMRLPGVRR